MATKSKRSILRKIPSASSLCEIQIILVLFGFMVLDEIFLGVDFLDLVAM